MFTSTLASAGGRLRQWLQNGQRSRQRRVIADIPDFILKDIGLTRADLQRSAASRSLGW